MKNVLVAGGTDGIGLAFVRQTATRKENRVFVLGRGFSRIKQLRLPNVTELACDITDQKALINTVKKINQPIDEFINTIGTFHRNPTDEVSPDVVIDHFKINTTSNIILTNAILPKLNKEYAKILVCSATLALEARKNYALQSATKAAYRYYLEALQKEKSDTLKVTLLFPSSVNTSVFKKANDLRDTSIYPSPDTIATIMHFILEQPRQVHIPELRINNFPLE